MRLSLVVSAMFCKITEIKKMHQYSKYAFHSPLRRSFFGVENTPKSIWLKDCHLNEINKKHKSNALKEQLRHHRNLLLQLNLSTSASAQSLDL